MNYINVIQIFESFANGHDAVQRFKADTLDRMEDFTNNSEEFPLLYCVLNSSQKLRTQSDYQADMHSFNVYCLVPRIDVYPEDDNEIILNQTSRNTSQCYSILSDMINWFDSLDYNWLDIDYSNISQPVNNITKDRLQGVFFTVQLSVMDNSNCCIDVPKFCKDVRIYNSDETIDIKVESGGTYVMPDTTYLVEYENGTDIEVGTVSSGGNIIVQVPNPIECEDVTFTLNTNQGTLDIPSGETINFNIKDQNGDIITPSGFSGVPYDFDIEITIPEGVEIMKTFQTDSYVASDDGALQFGSVNLVNWFTLVNANPFGNYNRWTDEFGGQTYTNNIVIDWLRYKNNSVIGYYRVVLNYGDWITSVPLVANTTLGGFTNWHMTNMEEMRNIYYRSVTPAYNFAPFNFNTIKYFWTSTTHTDGVQAIIDQANYYAVSPYPKNVILPSLACRYFTVNGTTLS